ncbi:hypothetical protein J4E85_010899 [Alternaria conjuncta]|uniref:uncharacterized protein n=1 Tax=Alternaria conjuncta TaxID=181017 RepID=UPI00221E6D7F|nr:uncharacterized protein J4E85_010899 [Alternaria conjuncta]KAI4913166.1 hypothetical protein J4E85_010899 [Alternaria conjuncta]
MSAMRDGVFVKEKGDDVGKNLLGIAISGGVDSMALAALYAQSRLEDPKLPIPHGFIVDHKVRPESTEEAKWVSQQLHTKLGIPITILPLTWPDAFDPNDSKRFETEARTLRYQALGLACRSMKITRLMLAHHADDQAETVVMRLANNRLRSGLQAMQRREWIPECEGLHGVYHSGKHQKPDRTGLVPFKVEQGGVQILRPLLTFEKTRLIATCEEKGVAWAEDKTNQIKTLTSRNAIRHIYQNHKLPEALSVKSLVNISQHMQERIKWHRDLADKLFDKCPMKLDIQTGCLIVRFPPFSDLLPYPINTKADKIKAKNTAYCLLERVAGLVTPATKAPLGELAASAYRIYPELEELEENVVPGEALQKKNFCVYNVWWRFWDKPSPFNKPEHQEEGINPDLTHPREWLLTRQPLETLERANPELNIVYPPKRKLGKPSQREMWRLFDGRYWISLTNRLTYDNIVLRIFSKDDYLPTAHEIKNRMLEPAENSPYRFITAAFDLLKPADLRFTLPAVFRIDRKTGEQTLLGFPTLDLRPHGFGPPASECEWEVAYKKVDFGSRSAYDIIKPGKSRKDIYDEAMKGRPAEKKRIIKSKEVLRKERKMRNVLRNRQERTEARIKGSTGYDRAADVGGKESKRQWSAAFQDVESSMQADGRK